MSSNSKLNIGIVGCGVVATAYYLPYLMNDDRVRLVAVCDKSKERADACVRLFGFAESYDDYDTMIDRSDIDLVFILTGPGTHARFTLRAVEAGKHVLLQKPMALTVEDTNDIVDAVRRTGVKCVVEPSSNTLLDPFFQDIRAIIDRGALGEPYWFTMIPLAPTKYHPSLGGNPYGLEAFFTKDSGGMMFDYPYGPSQIVTLLGDCRAVTGTAKISVPERFIVPDENYTKYLQDCTDPMDANYWDVVLDMEKSQRVEMGAEDNVFCLYEMDAGWTGVFHVGRAFHPIPPEINGGGLMVFGSEGNLVMGGGESGAAFISGKPGALPSADENGWYRIREAGWGNPAGWPKPIPGGFNYYHESSRHIIDCILEDRDPLPNVEWGRHINETMVGAIASARSGEKYTLTTDSKGLRV